MPTHEGRIYVLSNLVVRLFVCLFVCLTRKQQICHCDSILFSLIWDRFLAMPIVLLPDLGLAFYTYRTLLYLQENKLVWQ